MKKSNKPQKKSSKKLKCEDINHISGGNNADPAQAIIDMLKSNPYTTRKPRERP